MEIIRSHRSPDNFTVVNLAAIEDNRLTILARGVLMYLLTLSDGDPTPTAESMATEAEPAEEIQQAFDELARYGYVTIDGNDWTITDTPAGVAL